MRTLTEAARDYDDDEDSEYCEMGADDDCGYEYEESGVEIVLTYLDVYHSDTWAVAGGAKASVMAIAGCGVGVKKEAGRPTCMPACLPTTITC